MPVVRGGHAASHQASSPPREPRISKRSSDNRLPVTTQDVVYSEQSAANATASWQPSIFRESSETAHLRSLPYQAVVKAIYDSRFVQVIVAVLIVLNFLCVCVQMQFDPESEWDDVWANFELIFNLFFLLELMVNMYGAWFYPFWHSGWNVFDSFVVSISVLDITRVPLPGAMQKIRLLRAFRIMRLFGRVESIRTMIKTLVLSLPGVASAFLVQLLVIAVYAVVGVQFYHRLNCGVHDYGDVYMTAREICHGRDYYGTFLRSMFTLFQVLTGDSWSEAIVRPTMLVYEYSYFYSIGTSGFAVSFILINSFVLLNVVVAVLMEGMSRAVVEDDEETFEEVSIDEVPTCAGVLAQDTNDTSQSQTLLAREEQARSIALLREEVADLRKETGKVTSLMRTQLEDVRLALIETLRMDGEDLDVLATSEAL